MSEPEPGGPPGALQAASHEMQFLVFGEYKINEIKCTLDSERCFHQIWRQLATHFDLQPVILEGHFRPRPEYCPSISTLLF